MNSPKRAAVIFIFITIVIDMLALGIIIPVLPKLVENFVNGDAVRAAKVLGLFGTVWAAMQFFCSPILGVLSDRYGRRPVILISNLGLGLDYIFMALAPSLRLLFVGRVVSGITSANITAASAYISDVTPPDKRSQGFGMIGMAFGIGFILGPALGGILGDIDPRLPFWGAAALSLINWLYGVFVLPESLPVEMRVPFEWRKANPIGSINLLRSRTRLMYLAVVSFVINLAHGVLPIVFVLYAGYRYQWNARDVGFTLAGVGLCSGITQGVLVGPVVKKLGERRTLLAGLICGTLGFIIFGWAKTGPMFWLGVPLISLWGLAGAVIQALMSRQVDAHEQGQLQGANGSLRGVAELITPSLFTITFAYFIAESRNVPGAPFYLSAFLLAIAALLAWRALD